MVRLRPVFARNSGQKRPYTAWNSPLSPLPSGIIEHMPRVLCRGVVRPSRSAFRNTRAMLVGLLAVLPCSLFGGQSLILKPALAPITLTDPVYPADRSSRIEFQIHAWTLPATAEHPAIFQFFGLGIAVYLWGDGRLAANSVVDTVVERQPCLLSISGFKNALVRIQRDVAKKQFNCEIWSYDG